MLISDKGPLSSSKARKAALSLTEFENDRKKTQSLLKLEYFVMKYLKKQGLENLLAYDSVLQ